VLVSAVPLHGHDPSKPPLPILTPSTEESPSQIGWEIFSARGMHDYSVLRARGARRDTPEVLRFALAVLRV